jgi:hypothetical protein
MPDHSSYSLSSITTADGRSAFRYTLHRDREPLAFDEVIRGWCEDAEFRAAYNELLATVRDFDGFYWEHPPLTRERLGEPYEFVLVPDQTLSRLRPDPTAFAEHFSDEALVVHFSNLGGDAELIVPCPRGDTSAYPHLAAFVRHAPPEQRDAFWQRVGERCRALIADRPRWLSTAGRGVSWLHVRLDTRSKYYKYGAYRS